MRDAQERVKRIFESAFGRTPLRSRLDDIFRESCELTRFTDLNNLKEESGDLLASLLQLMNEAGWDANDVLNSTLAKIESRQQQYHSLGRKINVAIFGGAFDMPTFGHLDVAQIVLDTSRIFDEVWLMPCYQHMFGKKMESPEHRLEMCKILTQYDGRIRVSDYEIKNKLAGETYHLVKRLLDDEEFKNTHNFSIIIGQDNANKYHTWVNYNELERLIRHVVVPRAGYNPDLTNPWYLQPPHIYLCNEKITRNTASSKVRNLYKSGYEEGTFSAEIFESIPMEIHKYILENRLYEKN